MIALGCDHGGYNLICAIKKYLDEKGLEYKEYGTFSEESVDYPVYAYKVATAITSGECSTGILCCGTGIGISIAANKVKGIRAAVVSNEFCAEMTRRHNNANILCMGGRVTSEEDAVNPIPHNMAQGFDAPPTIKHSCSEHRRAVTPG